MDLLRQAIQSSPERTARLRVGAEIIMVAVEARPLSYSVSVSRDNPAKRIGFDIIFEELFVDSIEECLALLHQQGYQVALESAWQPLPALPEAQDEIG
jgi:hypothetical protein